MIYSDTIDIVYSEVETVPVFSSEDQDYRRIESIRITEEEEPRITEDENKRILE